MQDPTPIRRRAGQLCQSLESDAELREEIELAGFPSHSWDELAAAIRTGSAATLAALLDAVEQAAAQAGLDGVTYPTREYRQLPGGLPEFRTVSGWRCPHAQRCARVHPAANPSPVRNCAATGDELTWISVDSG